jgi:hypothetical protein
MSSDQLAVLRAKQEIRDALSRYCRAMDRRDEPLAAALWHEGGSADYGEIFQGSGREFAAWVTETHLNFDRHSHQITNVLTEVSSSRNEAVSEAYVTVVLWSPVSDDGGVTQVTSRGRYLDRWACRDGRWAVVARQLVDDFTTAQQLSAAEVIAAGSHSRRDPDDPSYALFSSLP